MVPPRYKKSSLASHNGLLHSWRPTTRTSIEDRSIEGKEMKKTRLDEQEGETLQALCKLQREKGIVAVFKVFKTFLRLPFNVRESIEELWFHVVVNKERKRE